MKRASLLICLLFFFALTAFAQSGDVAFGVSGLLAPSTAGVDFAAGNVFAPSMGGGTYLNFTGDFLVRHHFGVEGEIAWRARQNLYLGYQPYRPLLYDFGGIWSQRFNKHFGAEATAGIGAESLRFYTGYESCGFTSCTDYQSSNHFLGAFGGGIKIYPWHNVFIRPEARLYVVHNNYEFNSNHSLRAGVSIGYTFGGE